MVSVQLLCEALEEVPWRIQVVLAHPSRKMKLVWCLPWMCTAVVFLIKMMQMLSEPLERAPEFGSFSVSERKGRWDR